MKVSTLFSGMACAFALAACAPTATDTDTGSAVSGDATSALDVQIHDGEFATIQQFVTPGGVSVWLVEEPSIPILSLRMAWQSGSANDPEGMEGLTSAMVYHMNEGAGELDAQAFSKRMEELSMSFGCSASNESTFCNASMLTDNASDSFDVISLALAEPRFDDGPFERFKREREVALKTRETNAGYLAGRAIQESLYPDHAYARELTSESLTALTQDAMRAQKDKLIVQDGLLVTAVGAMSAEALAPLIDQAIAGLPQSSETVETDNVVLAAANPEKQIIDLPQPQSLVRFSGPAMNRDDPDF